MSNIKRRLKKLEEQNPEQKPFPEFDPDNPKRSLFEMIEHTHKYPSKTSDWDEEETGCSCQSYVEVQMQKGDEDE